MLQQLSNEMTNFDETWYEYHMIEATVTLNLMTATPTWRQCERLT
jgi:hypothetical protein